MNHRGFVSAEHARTVQPSKLFNPQLNCQESDWVLNHRLHLQDFGTLFTLSSTRDPSFCCFPLPFPFPSVQPGWAEGLKLHSLCAQQAEKKKLLWFSGPSSLHSPRHEPSLCFARLDHQKLQSLQTQCESVNRKRLSMTLPAQRRHCQSLRKVFLDSDSNRWVGITHDSASHTGPKTDFFF